jgi:dUTP pyrophosphatase
MQPHQTTKSIFSLILPALKCLLLMKVNIVNTSKHALPAYETEASAGMDLRAELDTPVTLRSLERQLIPTGLFIELPAGYEAQIRPRSGLAIKHGISLVNAPGTIDADYRGEIKIILVNLSKDEYTINDGERIAQMIISKVEHVQWTEVDELQQTSRGAGGFGHTGNK